MAEVSTAVLVFPAVESYSTIYVSQHRSPSHWQAIFTSACVFELGELTVARSERLIPRAGGNKTSVILAANKLGAELWAHESCPGRRVSPRRARRKKIRGVVARPKFPALAQCRVDKLLPRRETQCVGSRRPLRLMVTRPGIAPGGTRASESVRAQRRERDGPFR